MGDHPTYKVGQHCDTCSEHLRELRCPRSSVVANKDSEYMDSLREREDQAARIIQRVLNLSEPPVLLVAMDSENVEVQQGIDLTKRALGRIKT